MKMKKPKKPRQINPQIRKLAESLTDATYDINIIAHSRADKYYMVVFRGHFMTLAPTRSITQLKDDLIDWLRYDLWQLCRSAAFWDGDSTLKQYAITLVGSRVDADLLFYGEEARKFRALVTAIVDVLIEKNELQFVSLDDELLTKGRKVLWQKNSQKQGQ